MCAFRYKNLLYVAAGINFDSVKLTQAADIGTDYTVLCNVGGEPKPVIGWRKESPIPAQGSTFFNFLLHYEGHSVITDSPLGVLDNGRNKKFRS